MTTGRINQVTSVIRITHAYESNNPTNKMTARINETVKTFTLTWLSNPIVPPYLLTLHSINNLKRQCR